MRRISVPEFPQSSGSGEARRPRSPTPVNFRGVVLDLHPDPERPEHGCGAERVCRRAEAADLGPALGERCEEERAVR